jgi:hypothetical protein
VNINLHHDHLNYDFVVFCLFVVVCVISVFDVGWGGWRSVPKADGGLGDDYGVVKVGVDNKR